MLLPDSLGPGQQSPFSHGKKLEHIHWSCFLEPPGGGDQHCASWGAEAAVSKNQNCGCQYDPGWGHPAHPQRRVHGLSVPQHRCGWLRQHTLTLTFLHTHKANITKHTPMTKNQVYSNLYFSLLFLFVLLLLLTEIGFIYCMLHMTQPNSALFLWYVTYGTVQTIKTVWLN